MKIQDKKIILHALKFTHCLKINKVIEVKNEKKEVNQLILKWLCKLMILNIRDE